MSIPRTTRRLARLLRRPAPPGPTVEEENRALHATTARLRRERDRADRENRAKSRFLAGMSHELRTPLNGVLGYAQLLQHEGGLNTLQASRLDSMLEAGAHLLQVINCVLDLSQIETERGVLQATEVDLHRLASACLDLVLPIAAAKRVSLTLAIAPLVPHFIMTDPARLQQVLLNLLGNAVKFTRHGAVQFRLSLEDGASLRFEVLDSGPGIAPAQRHRLFQEFARINPDNAIPLEGAGLGLFLSTQLATLLGGQLGHTDNPAGGSVFWLTLPLVPGLAPHQTTPPPPVEAPAAKLRVLVVDDVAMNRDIAAAFLRTAGHQADCADSGQTALDAVAMATFDVILMDIRMPGMDGLETVRRLRALPGAAGTIPVVAMTAQAFTEQVIECHHAGIAHHVAKPFTLPALLAALAAATSGAPAELPPDQAPEHLILDPVAFAHTVNLLEPGLAERHLRGLADACRVMQSALNDAAAPASAEAAHALAGSAGLFGLDRLSAASRRYERSLRPGAIDGGLAIAALRDTLHDTLEALETRLPACLSAPLPPAGSTPA